MPAARIVAVDESNVNINMQCSYSPVIGGPRVVDSSPVNRPASRTIIGGLTIDGLIAFSTWLGGTTKDCFETYADKVLLPELARGDIVIMDNLSAHHASRLRELIENAGASVPYTSQPRYESNRNVLAKNKNDTAWRTCSQS